ncbi:hypothetical protein [Aeromicrobium phragmitis]|uniref:hypothetical protein n=1 Tax=Aeromicrobium phragmitis TaxID=2478914 RepID=UPI00105DB7C2|nr:hypothetical protein [Aeromicrobium phragmitis]
MTQRVVRAVVTADAQFTRAFRRAEGGDEPPPPNWDLPLLADLTELEIYGSKRASDAGRVLLDRLYEFEEDGGTVGAMEALDQAREKFVRACRADFGS